jgi:hypothetical protein
VNLDRRRQQRGPLEGLAGLAERPPDARHRRPCLATRQLKQCQARHRLEAGNAGSTIRLGRSVELAAQPL